MRILSHLKDTSNYIITVTGLVLDRFGYLGELLPY